MKIELREIKIRDVVNGFVDSAEDGVVGFGGNLNIRPAFQREFIYKPQQRDEVINTIIKGFPLNVMYWVKSGSDTYELLDGQQRTISFCQYYDGNFSFLGRYFHSLTKDEKNKFLDYPLMIYICEGSDKEKLDWFKIINIAGVVLTAQELRNAVYTGPWLSEAKRHFSKTDCAAYKIACDYLKGDTIRQIYLETALRWITDRNNMSIEEYMSKHQEDADCDELWQYFQSVIDWIKRIFPPKRKNLMQGLEWGLFYNKYGNNSYNATALENRIVELLDDEDVTNHKGIYEYLLSGKESYLSLRTFTDKQKRTTYEKQQGICPKCLNHFEYGEMEGDHITPWSKGGKTVLENCQMLCKDCNRRKSDM